MALVCCPWATKEKINAMAAPDRALLARVGQSLRVTTVDGHPNLTKSELCKVAATARALAASAEAEIGARPAPFPAELRPALVMQWLPLHEAAAAFAVSGSWREDAEQYFRRYAQREGIPRGDSWYASVRWTLLSKFTVVQRRVFMYYAKHWARKGEYNSDSDSDDSDSDSDSDSVFIPVDEVVAAISGVSAEQCKAAIAFLVSLRKLIASPTGGGHRCELQVVDLYTFLNPLPELQWRVLKYHIAAQSGDDSGCAINDVAADLGIDLDQAQTTVDSLVSLGLLFSMMDDDDYYCTCDYRVCDKFRRGLTPLQQRVLDYYTERGDEDCHFNDAVGDFHINRATFRRAVDFLRLEGRLYADIDDVRHRAAPYPAASYAMMQTLCSTSIPPRRCELRYASG